MAFFGFQKAPSGVTTEDQAQAERSAAWQDLRRSGDLGNVLLNFGLNMMANSETQGLGAAAGGAGLNALQDYRSVMAARQKQAQAEQARQDTLKQNEIANKLARDRLNYDIEHGTEQNKIARETLLGTQQTNGLNAYKTLMEIQRANAARQAMGLPPLQMPSIPGMPSFGVGTGVAGGASAGSAPSVTAAGARTRSPFESSPFVPSIGADGQFVLPVSYTKEQINDLIQNGTVTGLGQREEALIRAAAREFGVPENLLLAQAMQESSGQHMVLDKKTGQMKINTSPANAVGIMQVVPKFAKDFGFSPDDAYTLEGNIRLGAAEMKQRLDESGGDLVGALMGYNYGPGNLIAYRKTGRGQNGAPITREAYTYPDMVFGRITPKAKREDQAPSDPATAQAPAAAPKSEAPAPAAQPAAQSGQQTGPAEAPIVIGGVQVTPQWIATRQQVAAMYPETNEGKQAKMELDFYNDEIEARRKFAKDNKETGVKMNDVAGLGTKWASESSSYTSAVDGLSQLLASAKAGDPMGDVAMVFNFMKSLDPNSVVREGEFATAKNAGGVDQRILSIYNDALGKGMLTPEKRQQLVRAATEIVKARRAGQSKVNERYTRIADSFGVAPNLVIAEDIWGDLEPQIKEYLGTPAQTGGAGKNSGATVKGSIRSMLTGEDDSSKAKPSLTDIWSAK